MRKRIGVLIGTALLTASLAPTAAKADSGHKHPHITSWSTYTNGGLVVIAVSFNGPADGFGFVGSMGSGWAEENHPFTSPSFGIVNYDPVTQVGRVDYPFNHLCGTSQQYDSYIKFWITDSTDGKSSDIQAPLRCND